MMQARACPNLSEANNAKAPPTSLSKADWAKKTSVPNRVGLENKEARRGEENRFA